MEKQKRKSKVIGWVFLGIVLILCVVVFAEKTSLLNLPLYQDKDQEEAIVRTIPYGVHKNISVTVFWIGERAGLKNSFIPNSASAWDSQWRKHYGGFDDPDDRNDFNPAEFVPEENPFYFALPYNDMDFNGRRKKEAYEFIPWASSKAWGESESMCKNQWIMITKNGKFAYAQWEDVGPYGENDSAYVFGNAEPENGKNENAGIDVSPAVRDYLQLEDIDNIDWQFIDFKKIPDGPWRETITNSQIFW